jgi:hypothetical protein
MAITTLDGLLAGMQSPVSVLKIGTTMEAIGVLHSLAYATGNPGATTAVTLNATYFESHG